MRLILTIFLTLSALLASSLPIKIKEGMKYEKAREILLNSGWQTVTIHITPNGTPAPCWADWEKLDYYSCKFKEIDNCSGTGMGYCLMWFYDGESRYLRVVTSGGEPPNAVIDSWEKTKDKPTIEIYSPSKD